MRNVLFFFFGFGHKRFAVGHVGLGCPHSLGAAIEPLIQIAQLAMNAMQRAKDLGTNGLWFWHWREWDRGYGDRRIWERY